MLDLVGRMLRAVRRHPIENLLVVIELVGDFLKRVAFDAEKREEMFVEPNGLVVVAVE